MASELDVVARLERALLSSAVRADRTRLEQLLHPAFVEIGASGRRWTRGHMIAALLASPTADDVEAGDLVAESVAADAVLVTYVTRRGGSAARRASLWVLVDGGWQVRFHQGTPMP